ncbi:MAG: UDP-N-acetylmuramate dehydrogenase [Acidiferrobacterales bacterium]|nr:UDP-N-acetylmuramate dehydrogenase [Acidiferrobacterales bacterium]
MSVDIREQQSLQDYNAMAVPAQARFLTEVKSLNAAEHGLRFAKEKALEVFVLGEGSNTLFTRDFPGLILLNRLLGMEVIHEDDKEVVLKVAAGENWHALVAHTINQNWYGLENLALIPGLVGAAPIQNIGAYGVEVKDYIVAVEFLDFDDLSVHSLTNSDCQFSYRDSIFKHSMRNKGLITSVTFCLNKGKEVNFCYPSLAQFLSDTNAPTAKNIFDAVVAIRSEKLPSPDKIPNLGSFFKNPIVDTKQYQRLKENYPDMVCYAHEDGYKLAAAWLIDRAGWKDKKINKVRVHQQQALVIINPQKVEGVEILNFANRLRSNIHQKFGITLEIEPTII